ncbi:MAG: 4Fe-4S binding protein [Rhodobacteraceae bacterium]|nr:4Fe-4S binding protein [Paracoccaceae bacterium]
MVSIWRLICLAGLALALVTGPVPSRAEAESPLSRSEMEAFVAPPFILGDAQNDKGVWGLLNSGGTQVGYAFETEPMAPLPGFAGAPINLFVMLDLEGRFLEVRLISHNEPIFVSGLGEAPFREFFKQYHGLSISQSLVVGTPYGAADDGSALVYLDGVTKATASVRIAHESLLAATRAVAREKMQGLVAAAPRRPDPDHQENLTWVDLVDQGLVTRRTVTNAEIDAAFAGTLWAHDDPEASANPDGIYLDLWVVDIGPPAIARAVLSPDGFEDLQGFMSIADFDEPILVIEAGRHGLVSPDFVRNTSPDWLSAEQDGLPVPLRDSDLYVELARGVPEGTAMILRTDRRLGFDPAREWQLNVLAVREHGSFRPEIGTKTLSVTHVTPERFFLQNKAQDIAPPWLEALRNRQVDMIVAGLFLVPLLLALGPGMKGFARHRLFTPMRLVILAFVTVFIGWWGQGQLSIATVLGVVRTALSGGSFAFLIYDPFSLLIWAVTIVGFVLWGRGLFCGWLCPFGALQEFAHHIGRGLRVPQITPSAAWDKRLKTLKYVLLAGLVATVFIAPQHIDTAVEIEPFKTAITVFFVREWYYVLYAVFWLVLGMSLFKGFCRYVCPLGAVMAIGGLLRGRDWIERRAECGSPCQLCRVKCRYGAIERDGKIDYIECFQCLGCVSIYEDPQRCVPLVLAGRRPKREAPIK